MLDLPQLSLYSICVFGIGGLVVGLLGLLASRNASTGTAQGPLPALLALAVLGACCLADTALRGLGWPLLALAALLLLLWLARLDRLARALGAISALARAPRWQWAALAVGCPIAAALLALGASPITVQAPPVRTLPPGTVLTDKGRNVPVEAVGGGQESLAALRANEARSLREHGLTDRAIQVRPADWSCNCHGWTFTGGRYLIADADVEPILQDNDYSPVEQPEVSDLVIYRDEQGSILHSARVWGVGEGGKVLLESKWAAMGLYIHPPDATPYGHHWTYYRSPRAGHHLRGIDEATPEAPSHPTPVSE
jgi:hypothetical protein